MIIIALMVFSALVSKLPPNVILVGREPDYMGILAWLSMFPFGLYFEDRLKSLLFSFGSVLIVGCVLIVSLMASSSAVANGYRMPGLMMQATTMGAYGAMAAALGLESLLTNWQKRNKRLISSCLVLLAYISVFFTQSRAGYLLLILAFAFYALRLVKNYRVTSFLLVVGIVLLPLLPRINPSYFSRFNATSIQRGSSYRTDIYKVSGKEALHKNFFIGNGPSALPVDLNNHDVVPEDISKTLGEGFTFASSHDIFLDMALYFGVLATACFALIAVGAGYAGLRNNKEVLIVYLILLGNSLLNTVSPEMTVVLVMCVMSLITRPKITTKA